MLQSVVRSLQEQLKHLAKVIGYTTLGGALTVAFDQTVGGFRRVTGPSMVPTFNRHLRQPPEKIANYYSVTSNHALDDIAVYTRDKTNLERGNVVICKNPRGRGYLIKRLIGLPGDSVVPLSIGAEVREPVVVPEGHAWVESDAGKGYADSSLFGPIPLDSISGIATYKIRLDFYDPDVKKLTPEVPAESLARLQMLNPGQS